MLHDQLPRNIIMIVSLHFKKNRNGTLGLIQGEQNRIMAERLFASWKIIRDHFFSISDVAAKMKAFY